MNLNMKTRETNIPRDLLVCSYSESIDYADCFAIDVSKSYTISQITESIFTEWPSWIMTLFKIRNVLVSPFGISADKEELQSLVSPKFDLKVGGKVAFFDVLEVTDSEIVLSIKDKHLDSWFSIAIKGKGALHGIYLTTYG